MKRIFLFLIIVSGSIFNASAQIVLSKGSGPGITIECPVTEEKIIEIFGQPQQTWTEEGGAIDGVMKTFVYKNLRIAVVDGYLFDFSFSNRARNDDCVVVINNEYRLKLGDNFSVFMASIPSSDVIARDYGENVMQLFFKTDKGDAFSDSSLHVTLDNQGLVTLISWVSPV
ncbi:hypothetical protein [Alistipes sp.]|uniref:hypothetical protein n=1 Tax=Alistipes sp. TaxID=1872444 RepID=UPI003AEF7F94